MKLTDQILKIVERIMVKLTRQEADINEVQFGFTPGCGDTDVIFP